MEQKTEIPGIYKVREGILINKDNDALTAYKKQKQKSMAVDYMQNDIAELKNDIQEIKDLLKGLIK